MGFRGRLVFEPYFSAPGGVPQNTWQSWNTLTASSGWWTTMAGATLCTQSVPCSWTQVLANYPNAAVPASAYGFVGIRGGNAAIDGNVDNFALGTASTTTIYDFEPETQCTSTCYVDATNGNDAFGGDSSTSAKKTIQAAVNQVASGGTVHVAAGTYAEQIVADSNMTIDGAGAGSTTIKAPASLSFGSDPARYAIVDIKGGANVEMSDLTVSGPGPSGCGSLHYGILVTGAAHLNAHDMTVADIRDSSLSGCQNGNGIQVGRQAISQTGTADIDHVTVSGYQKTGLIVDNTGSSMTVTNSTITGVGATALIAQNGIQISRGATATVSDSTISYNEYTGTGADSTSVLLFQAGDNVTLMGNVISGSDVGIDLSGSAGTGNVAHKNSIHGNAAGIVNDSTSSFDATCNWWGSSTGPGTVGLGTGDTVSSNVSFTPWLLSSVLTGDCPAITVHGTGAVDANGAEGSLISTSGSFDGSTASITADNAIGTFAANAGAGTWTWSYTPADQFTATTINVTAHGTNGTTAVDTFSTSASNVAPTATFVHPTTQLFGTSYALSLTSPSDPSAIDAVTGFTYQFDCGSGYVATGSTDGYGCTAPSTPGSITVKAKITDKDGDSNEYTYSLLITQQNITASDLSGHNFGDQNINAGASSPFTFTATNDGNADLTLGTAYISGPNATSFSVDTDNCAGHVITPAHSCTIEVIFDPATTNAKSATLNIPSNDPDENPLTRALTGNGTSVVVSNGTITINLDARPDGAQSFAFTGGLGAFSLTDPASNTFSVSKPAGTYAVQAAKVNGWALKSLTCDTSETVNKTKRKVTINLASGQNVTCTYTETKRLPDGSIALASGGPYTRRWHLRDNSTADADAQPGHHDWTDQVVLRPTDQQRPRQRLVQRLLDADRIDQVRGQVLQWRDRHHGARQRRHVQLHVERRSDHHRPSSGQGASGRPSVRDAQHRPDHEVQDQHSHRRRSRTRDARLTGTPGGNRKEPRDRLLFCLSCSHQPAARCHARCMLQTLADGR